MELEQLRTLLKRGAGIGTPSDGWTPYTGPDEEEIIRRQIASAEQNPEDVFS